MIFKNIIILLKDVALGPAFIQGHYPHCPFAFACFYYVFQIFLAPNHIYGAGSDNRPLAELLGPRLTYPVMYTSYGNAVTVTRQTFGKCT
jgi:hypothetical protein